MEYLDKIHSYENSTKEVILWFQVIFAMHQESDKMYREMHTSYLQYEFFENLVLINYL